jgi:uncharacterized protein
MQINKRISKLLNNNYIQLMKQFKQHKDINTYEHCVNVMKTSLKIAKHFNLTLIQVNNLIIGSILHDFYLYDYHVTGRIRKHEGIHAWSHPKRALINANNYFNLNKRQQNIIRSHMFPTTLFHPPLCKEALIVCIADKVCAFKEYYTYYRKKEIHA